MALPKCGTYIAGILDHGIQIPDDPKKSIQWEAKFECRHQLIDGEWRESDNETITGWFYLTKNQNSEPNTRTVENIRDSVGWTDGRPSSLNALDLSSVEVQIVIDDEEDQKGQTRRKVKWINPRDYQGGTVQKADAFRLKDIDSQWGAKFRAVMGDGGRKPTPATSPAGNAASSEKMAAWTKFREVNQGIERDALAEKWKSSFKAYFGVKHPDMVGAAEWSAFAADGFAPKAAESPIGDEQHFASDDIPF